MKKMKRWISSGNASEENILQNIYIETIVSGGDGLARAEGKVVFVPLVIPGETIDLSIIEEKKKFRRGICRQIIKPSEHRLEPFCPYYGVCGGCNLQHMDYDYQLQVKKEILKDLFRKFAGIELHQDVRFVPSPPLAYRHRIQIHSDGKAVGFKKRGSDAIAAIEKCPLLTEPLNSHIAALSPDSFRGRKMLFNQGDSIFEEGDEREISYELLDRTIRFRADLFFQSNHFLLPELVKYVMEDLSPGEEALDLYCGTGLFSLFLKDRYKKITAIEMNPLTEKYYHSNMKGSDYSYYGFSLEQWIRKGLHRKHRHLDLVIVDPPRTGLSESVRSFLTQCSIDKLIYVSCDPVTQARDTKILLEKGYIMEDMRGFDFYPHSNHMENVVKFTRN